MNEFDYLKIEKRRENIAKTYRVVGFHDADMQFSYKIQGRFLWWWVDVLTSSLQKRMYKQVQEYKEYNDAIAEMKELIDSELAEWVKKKSAKPC